MLFKKKYDLFAHLPVRTSSVDYLVKRTDIPSNLSKKTATNKNLIDDQIVKHF